MAGTRWDAGGAPPQPARARAMSTITLPHTRIRGW
jgi:hypothetical protein